MPKHFSHFTCRQFKIDIVKISYGKDAKNKWDFSLVLKVCRELDDVTSAGKLFHVGAAVANSGQLRSTSFLSWDMSKPVGSYQQGTSGCNPPTYFNHHNNIPRIYQGVLQQMFSQSAFWPFKVDDFGTNRKRICNFLLVRHCDYGPILHRFWDMATYWLKIAYFSHPSLIWRPHSLCSLWNFAAKLTTRKLESRGYPTVKTPWS